jgi:GTP diphosphokinase / guanosine-3',5'-bis(diphosphate) 3'-diphosphatase
MNKVSGDTGNLLNTLLEELRKRSPRVKLDIVETAFRFSDSAHKGQLRKSGEPFVTHCTQVATILIDLLERRMDTPLVCSALLHDVIEDGNVTVGEIEEAFGKEVAYLVDGVTKIGGFKFRSKEVEQAEYFRKMLLSMASDVRVVLIKLADRLHNMRTLGSLDVTRIIQTAEETRDIYAPLAHRLGIWKLKWELEDLAFKFLDPETYREISDKVAQAREDRERYVEGVKEAVSKRLTTSGIKADVQGRPKHFASIYRKMKERDCPFEEIYDLIGVRIIATSKAECYRVLGIAHDLYPPVHDRFKDYIATPKSNMYQSLHTTVFGPKGEMVEFQIRSREMDRTAELGIAAHYSYKEGVPVGGELQKVRELLRQATEWQEGTSDPEEFMSLVRQSLYHEEVFVFTPRGDVKHLPRGSTALDFAYAVHTQVGHHCVGARVNGKLVSIKHVLASGETVEIVTSPSARPSEDWVKIVQSSGAKSKVRHWLRLAGQQDSITLGKEILEKELKKNRLPSPDDLADVAVAMGFQSAEQLLAGIGRGEVSIESVLLKISPRPSRVGIGKVFTFKKLRDLTERRRHYVRIQGISNLMVSFAHCCEPIPGDRIIGIVTHGRGVSVHRTDCPNTFDDRVERGRRIDVEWDVGKDDLFVVNLVVKGTDRPNLLVDIAKAISETNTNIKHTDMDLVDGEVKGRFVVDVQDLRHLERVIKAIAKVKNVTRVERGKLLPEALSGSEPEKDVDR